MGDKARTFTQFAEVKLGDGRPVLLWYAAGLATIALVIAVTLAETMQTSSSPWVILLVACVAVVAERGSVQMSTKMDLEESISLLPILFAAVLLGPLAGLFVAAASMMGDFKRPYLRWCVYTSSRAIIGAVTGITAMVVEPIASSDLGAIVLATLAGAVVAQVLDIGFACLTVWLRGTTRPSETARTIAPVALAAVPLYAPVVVLLTIAYQELSLGLSCCSSYQRWRHRGSSPWPGAQRQLTEGLSSANQQLENANLSFAARARGDARCP